MSRVRIYDLAKEIGISGKELASKLMDKGFDVKGHSSTVDDETAEKIRTTILSDSDSEQKEKRVCANSGSTVIRRKSTIIRRRPKAEAEEADAVAEEQTEDSMEVNTSSNVESAQEKELIQKESDSESQKSAISNVKSEDSVKESAVSQSNETPVVKEPSVPLEQKARVIKAPPVQKQVSRKEGSQTARIISKPQVIEKEQKKIPEKVEKIEKVEPTVQPIQPGLTEKTVSTPAGSAVMAQDDAKTPVAKAQEVQDASSSKIVTSSNDNSTQKEHTPRVKDEKKKTDKKVKREPNRKNFARVVGTIDIPLEDKEEKPASRPVRKRNPVRGEQQHHEAAQKDESLNVLPGSDPSRVKKRGRKEETLDDDDDDRKGGRGLKKGRKSVKFTHFANEGQGSGSRRGKRGKGRKELPPSSTIEMKASKKRIKVYDTITVADLAMRMRVKASEVIAKLMGLGVMATMNQAVDVDTAMLIATDFGYEIEQGVTEELGIQMLDEEQTGGDLRPRPPVVTVMGHVDHGKTSILDAIRKTDVADGEAGGITQHIGAYHVKSAAGDVTFVDTPGHAAFTEMRARGAQVTDLVVLVVAADDGVMDQTREAIRHAQAGDVPILVCVNKIDKENADPDRVKRELAEYNLAPEEWGGQTIYCETSAKQHIGIDELIENIQLMAEILELKADPNRKAKGRVIEAKLDKGRGAVATVMVQEGTLRNGDFFVAGIHSGKVRAMLDDKGRKIEEAGPSIPVEVQGLSGVPSAGDEFIVVTDEKMAKSVSHARMLKARENELGAHSKISLDKLFEQMNEGEVKELKVVLRADVQGTLEAFAKAAEELSTDEIRVKVLHEGTGTITESDILLASASEAIIIGFNVRPTAKVKELAGKENVDIRAYDVIYHALDDIRKAMVGMLDPTYEEDIIGTAEVRDTFSVPKVGTIAGCSVIEGKIVRNAQVRVIREGVVIYTGKISSLRRFKDDVKEVVTGFECGIGVENYNDIKIDDHLEAFLLKEVEATL